MKENIFAIVIIGMLLLSSFLTSPVTSSGTDDEATINAFRNETIVFNNGMDYVGFYAAQWDENLSLDAYPADDFQFDEDTQVNTVNWIGGYFNGNYSQGDFDWNVTFYYDRGDDGAPGSVYMGPYTYTPDQYNQTFLEENAGIYYEFSVDLPTTLNFTANEKYWISIYGIGAFPPQSGWGYNNTLITLHQAVFKSEFFGYSDWNDTIDVFDTASDMCFQLASTEQNVTAIIIKNEVPNDDSIEISISQSVVTIYISASVTYSTTTSSIHKEIEIPFNWTMEGKYVQAAGANGAAAGTKTANLTSLPHSTQIVWYVNVTANGVHRNEIFHFTTQSPPNRPTIFGTPSPTNGSTGQPKVFNWSIPITDPEGDTFNWTIQCSNGQQNGLNSDTNGTKKLALSGLDRPKAYYVWVNATDAGSGKTTRAKYNFATSVNTIPIVNFTSILQDLTLIFNSSLTKDPDGIANRTWNFGDDSITYNEVNPTHRYARNGTYNVTLTVKDNEGATNNTKKTINVKNNPPVADFNTSIVGKQVSFNASKSSDTNGFIASYFWEFGDGTNGTGKFVANHNYPKDYKTYTVNLTVTDSAGWKNTTSKYVPIKDVTSPTVKIDKPLRALYINDKFVRRIFIRPALIIGDITITVNVTDSGSGIKYVQLWIGKNLTENKTTGLFNYTWKKDRLRLVHLFKIKVVAYDKEGNSATKTMIVKKYL